jgi:hypothetical protein
MGGKALDGDKYTVNTSYMLKNGKPFLPIMGEFHLESVILVDNNYNFKIRVENNTNLKTVILPIHKDSTIFEMMSLFNSINNNISRNFH